MVTHVLNRHQARFSNPIAEVPKKDIVLVLPYLGFKREVVTRHLKSCVNKFYGFVVFQSTRRIKSFFPYKGTAMRFTLVKRNVAYVTVKKIISKNSMGPVKLPRLQIRSQHKMGPFSSFSSDFIVK